jgi:predicted P-loop ATPase
MISVDNTNTISTKSPASTTLEFDTIASHHWDEWKESAVSDDIIRLNVKSIYDAREIDKILGRNTTRKWKHSNDLIPAWYASGIDPLTDEATLQGVQVKPDNTPINKDGKPQKYIGASGMETAPLFLRTTIEAYWKSIIDDILQFVIITEGAKKAAAGLSAGYPTISIPGVSTCRKKGRLHPLLELFAVLGRTFYLCFDNDILYKKTVQDGLMGLAKELAARGSKVMIIKLPPGDAKGMDDYLSLHGKEAFDKLIASASTFEEYKEELAELQLEPDEDEPKSKIAMNFQIINEAWGDSLRYNILKKEIEFNGFPIDVEHLKLLIGLQFPINIAKDDAFMIVEYIAKQNAYSPVIDYLDEVEAKFPDIDTSFLDGLAKLFFGTSDPLHAKYLKNFLVASVARARNPGCWMDCALLLFGKQGIRKSTFWRTLYGDDFFSDDLGNSSDKDERMKMHRFWCLEWSEFETVYKHKDVETLKAFLARKHETFRTPYDRLPKDYKRSCLFVGTTNKEEILHDPTGSRRFWIIPVSRVIPTEEALKLRDRIWAAANALYKAGYSYRLTDEEDAMREIQNEQYEAVDPWEEIIAPLIENRHYVTLNDVYDLLAIEISQRDIRNKNRITSVLRRLNCEPDRIKVSGKWVRIWREKNNFNNFQKSSGSSGSDENSTAETTTQQDSQPDPVENRVVDQVRHDTSSKTDPVEEVKIEIPLSQCHSKGFGDFQPQKSSEKEIPLSQAHSKASSHSDPLDPADPLLLEKKENLEEDFNYGDRVKLLTDCHKYTAGTEMTVYAVGHHSLKLIPLGVVPRDVSDKKFTNRLKDQVEKLPRIASPIEISADVVYWHEESRRKFKVVKTFKSAKTCQGYFEREIEMDKLKWSDLTELR